MGVVVAIIVIGVERTSVAIVGIATSVEPRIAGIHEVRVGATPRLVVTRNGPHRSQKEHLRSAPIVL